MQKCQQARFCDVVFKRKKDDEILKIIKKCYAELTGVNNAEITSHTKLYGQMELSSLGVAQLTCLLEDKFDITFPSFSFWECRTVNDLIKMVKKAVKKEGSS